MTRISSGSVQRRLPIPVTNRIRFLPDEAQIPFVNSPEAANSVKNEGATGMRPLTVERETVERTFATWEATKTVSDSH